MDNSDRTTNGSEDPTLKARRPVPAPVPQDVPVPAGNLPAEPLPPDATISPSGPISPILSQFEDPQATLPPNNNSTAPPQPDGTTVKSPALSEITLDPNLAQPQAYREAAQSAPPLVGGPAITTGATFGHYQLIEPIAKGGMGIVYKARQRNLNRVVAIKMILAGQFADQTDIDRFYAEAEAAAALSHPNIVAIHEIGEVQGQHFFSMEYIDGQSLSNLVHESPLPPKRAAELLQTIAETMQFAHDKGIVHRDLKPSNILLDKKGRPLITDFGLVKHVTGQSQITMAGAVIGTPSYMPPEQAAGDGPNVGPWSDLYSLGAILYETLTGRPPFRAATPFETIRQVLDTEPLSPRLVNPGVPRDLETICLKCLQKERSRRYASAQELADELARFRRGEPIQARPISNVARFWRLCRRNPLTSAAIAAAVLMLATTAVVSTVASVRTSAALDQSDKSLREAIGAVNEMFTTVSEDTLLNQPGMQPLRKDLLNKALTYYRRFLEQRANDPRVQDELAAAYFRVGLITEVMESPDAALAHYDTARQMQVDHLQARPGDPARLEALGNTLNQLGTVWTKKKDYAAALTWLREAADKRQQLAQAHADNSDYQRLLANTRMNIGLALFNTASRAKSDDEFNQWIGEARQEFQAAQQIREAALARDPTSSRLRRDLGKGHVNLGNLECCFEDTAPAAAQYKSAVAVFEKLAADQPGDLENQKLLAMAYRLLGDHLVKKDLAEGRQSYRQALDRLEPLARQNPGVIDYQTEQAGLWMNLFQLEQEAGQTGAAQAALRSAQSILAPLVQQFPAVPRYQRDLAATLRESAVLDQNAGEAKSAAANLAEALRILTALVAQYPSEGDYLTQLKLTQEIKLDDLKAPAHP